MLRPVALGDAARVGELVERALLEPDRERAQRLGALLGGERGEQRGVDAAGEQHADGHVADEVRAHGVAQARPQLLDELGLLVLAELLERRCRPREALRRSTRTVLPDQQVPGRELASLAEDRQRRGDRVEREERLEASRSISPRGRARSSEAKASSPSIAR